MGLFRSYFEGEEKKRFEMTINPCAIQLLRVGGSEPKNATLAYTHTHAHTKEVLIYFAVVIFLPSNITTNWTKQKYSSARVRIKNAEQKIRERKRQSPTKRKEIRLVTMHFK